MRTHHAARVVVATMLLLGLTVPAFSQGLVTPPTAVRTDAAAIEVAAAPRLTWTAPSVEPTIVVQKRPGALMSLYVTAGALQVMDLYTTSRGLAAGAHETNPLIAKGNAGTTIALKATTTALGIVIAEKMWKKNKAGAILTMLAANVVTAAVVANNYRVIGKLQGR
ncbi:MAG TPA: DUF5658 family protein [Vicinamibacterales bacterium]|nr:DUF5658 family protein [Vicinamibacterales bacterium]